MGRITNLMEATTDDFRKVTAEIKELDKKLFDKERAIRGKGSSRNPTELSRKQSAKTQANKIKDKLKTTIKKLSQMNVDAGQGPKIKGQVGQLVSSVSGEFKDLF
jgi:predicted Holliday junction resolvase-like endonuclease